MGTDLYGIFMPTPPGRHGIYMQSAVFLCCTAASRVAGSVVMPAAVGREPRGTVKLPSQEHSDA
jgi:hypothetical protein